MIHHYINLVCWRAAHDLYDSNRDVVWVDSVSLKIFVQMYSADAEYRAGTSILSKIGPEINETPPWFFLTARTLKNVAANSQIELPFLNDGEERYIPDKIMQAIMMLAPGTRIGLGVSSPKQNRLAAALYEVRPDLEYHCLGAALFALETNAKATKQGIWSLSGSGFEWIGFLVKTPRRTWSKIWSTLTESFRITFVPSSRRTFKHFAAICETIRREI